MEVTIKNQITSKIILINFLKHFWEVFFYVSDIVVTLNRILISTKCGSKSQSLCSKLFTEAEENAINCEALVSR